MSILVIAEHSNTNVKGATLTTLAAAQAIGGDIDLLITGENCSAAAEAASKIACVFKVLKADAPELGRSLAENMAPLIADLAKNYTHVLAPATTFGKNILPRTAALLDVQQISDVIAVIDADTFESPIYAGNAIARLKSSDSIKCITVRRSAFDPVVAEGGSAPIEDVASKGDAGLSSFVKVELSDLERPELTAASIVVSGGRGLGSGENFVQVLEPLADKLGAAIGASRAAVDAGYVPNDFQVGQTGKVVAPTLYIAVGISGAIQHVAGMKDSKVIVAIDKDADAPIFQIADYGLIADLFDAVPELTGKL